MRKCRRKARANVKFTGSSGGTSLGLAALLKAEEEFQRTAKSLAAPAIRAINGGNMHKLVPSCEKRAQIVFHRLLVVISGCIAEESGEQVRDKLVDIRFFDEDVV